MTKAKMPVDIRPLRAADQAGWQGLWTAYLAFYGAEVSKDVYSSTFSRLLGDDPQDFSCAVADAGGRLVGLTHYVFHRHAWKIENVCYLQDLYADPSVRGQGVGRKLIEAVYAAADKAGAPGVYWMTQTGNATARRLYDRIATPTDFMKYARPA